MEIASSGEKFVNSGSGTGTAHRAWMDIKSFFGSTDEALLEESILGEKAAVKEYKDVLLEISYLRLLPSS